MDDYVFNDSIFIKPVLKLFKLRESAVVPARATSGSACFDLAAAFEKDLVIKVFNAYNEKIERPLNSDLEFVLSAHERALIPTGFVFGIPTGYSLRIHPRSGLAWKHGITLANAEAVIDEDYPDETFVMLQNNSHIPFVIKNGDRIAQAELYETISNKFMVVTENPVTIGERTGGLGSTGV
ncbi:dUTPase [Sinorhizobium phage phiM7]|uniref:dUTP diphosphatase n=3 Tax=Emdodecavirus TaxID=1980937 RepID=S5M6I6_9CAUD|nr:dUTPase, deoxyuridine 5'-triphosphate nucleotidohydrolase [Sinorhizobium phage phiM12]YP_009212277.1 deoxyuridine 5'-triphosphate nucleotidohydrolase [Sinorhizobium phage phiN3]YP_009601147.1 dUTPase [Sinorhizobium phage phiM7]AKF12930.1 deoxyuridine 5'-triphosphate nucleotidohydrolase [Sinorhizobium phage phiM19]AGR47666.1 dUTPase, deoxyuridine 5'-triphosphate nucleotidohydrolase [Sinorhizobium phage phiM12]AKF12570.1 dUTPase [Sinorhizobium phage phiM7]AKF13302.1 deoxyuridine 5'-triphosph